MKRQRQLTDSPMRYPLCTWTLSASWFYKRQPWSSFKYLLQRNFMDHLPNMLVSEGIASKESYNIKYEPSFNAKLKTILKNCSSILWWQSGHLKKIKAY